MDVSPEPTVVLSALKDLNMFLGSSRTSSRREPQQTRLDFNVSDKDSSSFLSQSSTATELPRGHKRNLDSLVGFDVCKRLREKDSEIITTQATVTRLQRRLQEMELANKKAKLEAEASQYRQQKDKELIDDLLHKLKKMQKAKEEAQECVKNARAQWDTASLETGSRVVRLQQTHLEQTSEMEGTIISLKEEVLNLEKKLAEKTSKLMIAESHAEAVEVHLTELQNRLRQVEEQKSQAEERKLQLNQALCTVKELEQQLEELQDIKNQKGVFETTMQKFMVLEKELAKIKEDNKFLRNTARNTELLDEKLASALHQIEHLEKRCEDRNRLQIQFELCKESVEKFETIIAEEFNLGHRGTPDDLRAQLAKWKQCDKTHSDNLSQLRASHKSLESSRMQKNEELDKLKHDFKKQEEIAQQNAQQLKRLQRRLFLITKERDGLKDILSSYESEVTINYASVGQERIQALERQVDFYRREVEKLNMELQETCRSDVSPAIAAFPEKNDDTQKIRRLEEKVHSLEEVVEEMKREKEVLELRLEHRALKGDYDPTKTKVLHFKQNPHAKAVENKKTEIEKLQMENQALQERVKLLELGETEDLTQRVGVKAAADNHKKIVELQEMVSTKERQNKRLMEAFQRKSREMREMVYRLTGYRVDMLGESQYKLIHMYSDSSDDYLLFEHTPAKEVQLLETDFSSALDDLIDKYLKHENSYPAFLSAITLNLFQQQTRCNIQTPSDDDDEEEEEEEEEEMKAEEDEDAVKDEDQIDDQKESSDDDLVILD